MNLNEYVRPPDDNGRGVHWSPNQYQWGNKEWDRWQKRILELGLKWVKLNVPPDYNAEAVTKRLIDIDVMPVCRFIRKNPTRITGAIEKSIERLVELGVRYFETNNEPDADVEWIGFHRPDGWEQIVIENLIYDANRIFNIGGYPALVAFNTGPDEPRNAIQILLETPGGSEVLDKGMWVSLHNYGKGRPLNYPNDPVRMFGVPIEADEFLAQGQPDFWAETETRAFVWENMTRAEVNRLRLIQRDPDINIMRDITSFRSYEYWHTLITQEGVAPLPIMMTEGGWETGDRADHFFPNPTAQRASELNLAMFRFLQGDDSMEIFQPDGSAILVDAPDYLFALMPWHIGEKVFGWDTSGQWEQGAWFTHWHDTKFGLDGELPILQMLRDLPSNVRADGPLPRNWRARAGFTPAHADPWDLRMKYLGNGIRVRQLPPLDTPHWKVTAGYWQDVADINPDPPLLPGYILAKVLDERGQPLVGARVAVSRTGDAGETIIDILETKDAIDGYFANYQMTALLNTYRLHVLQNGHRSEMVFNLGLGREEPRSGYAATGFLFVFQLYGVPVGPDPTLPGDDNLHQPEQPGDLEVAFNNAAHLGVSINPADPQPVAKVVKVYHYQATDRMPPNMLFLDVVNANDQRIFQASVLLKDHDDREFRVRIEKPINEPGGNMPMWDNNHYRLVGLEINGRVIDCETVHGLRCNIPNHGSGHSFLVVLKVQTP